MGIVYRRMEERDVCEVAEIENRTFSTPWTKEGFLDSIELEYTCYLVAYDEDAGRVAGYCGLYQSFDEADITNVAVDEEYRRQGIAGRMINLLMEEGRRMGIISFSLEVRTGNTPAIELYKSLGFETAGCRKNFYSRPTEDAYIMTR